MNCSRSKIRPLHAKCSDPMATTLHQSDRSWGMTPKLSQFRQVERKAQGKTSPRAPTELANIGYRDTGAGKPGNAKSEWAWLWHGHDGRVSALSSPGTGPRMQHLSAQSTCRAAQNRQEALLQLQTPGPEVSLSQEVGACVEQGIAEENCSSSPRTVSTTQSLGQAPR